MGPDFAALDRENWNVHVTIHLIQSLM